ncbi:hypothetical protein FD63_05015 [Xanthomonas translucens pv. undulosa]|nr:hypothetical protein FD63_05015 [Xanthomonas translucens pv. undulosa]
MRDGLGRASQRQALQLFGIDHCARVDAAHVDRGGGAVGADLDAGQAGDRDEGDVGDRADGQAHALAAAEHGVVGALGDDGVGPQRQLADAVAAARIDRDFAAEAAGAAHLHALRIGRRLAGDGAGGGLGQSGRRSEGGAQRQREQGGPAKEGRLFHEGGGSDGGGGDAPRRPPSQASSAMRCAR